MSWTPINKEECEKSAMGRFQLIAERYIFGTEKEREIILGFFEGEERQTFLYCVGLHRLFCDQAYYDAVKKAVGAKLYDDLHK